MSTKMLIDAAHPEETRVVVLRDGKVEEFDFEAASRKQLRGNIYLAKVTRVEPSLQAAFVDYGGNRHGFLAFSEIHPDYYQIPYADRQALIAEEAEEEHDDNEPAAPPEAAEPSDEGNGETETEGGGTVEQVASGADDTVESVGGDDALEELPRRRSRQRKSYKIQEVIKKRQVLLVQVVKEERGTKGAALTTYLSLAGRYSVLMPNTARGGGISRKITNAGDRKRLKAIASDLEVPEGMGVILRTAGASRTKAEVRRDFEYLLRLWETVRELTLESVAPTLVYEEGSLVKRAIRDLYTKDISQVLIAGDAAYREAKDFMRMLMPSHAKNIQPFRDEHPLFFKYNVEGQLDAMFSPTVTLKAGGYIVLNQTEALVAIDVNSGRSTREHNIEDTALKTNLEAADEIARQLRLRDLAGLIVIDFIDMDEKRNNRAVERRLKDALKHDRARIQVGRISHFGLLEMSRQRIRFGVLESSLQPCAHCEGTGRVRSVESVALHVLRSIEYELLRGKPTDLTVRVRTPVALYILNQKRHHLRQLEDLGITIAIEADETVNGAGFKLEKGEPARVAERDVVNPESVDPDATETEGTEPALEADGDGGDERAPRRSRRRKRRRTGEAQATETDQATSEDTGGEEDAGSFDAAESDADGGSASRRRRRGRRGGRRHRREGEARASEVTGEEEQDNEAGRAVPAEQHDETAETPSDVPEPDTQAAAASEGPQPAAGEETNAEAADAEETKTKRRAPRKPRASRAKAKKPADEAPVATDGGNGEQPAPVSAESGEAAPQDEQNARPETEEPAPTPAPDQTAEPPRRGWWQRRNLFGG